MDLYLARIATVLSPGDNPQHYSIATADSGTVRMTRWVHAGTTCFNPMGTLEATEIRKDFLNNDAK